MSLHRFASGQSRERYSGKSWAFRKAYYVGNMIKGLLVLKGRVVRMRLINKFLNFISKRIVIVGLLILVQILWGISMLTRLTEYSSALNSVLAVLSLFCGAVYYQQG